MKPLTYLLIIQVVRVSIQSTVLINLKPLVGLKLIHSLHLGLKLIHFLIVLRKFFWKIEKRLFIANGDPAKREHISKAGSSN